MRSVGLKILKNKLSEYVRLAAGGEIVLITDRLGQPRICQKRTAARLWRYDFRNHPIAVGDQDGFATSGEADIFAKLVFENRQID